GDLPTEDFHPGRPPLISSCPCWAYTKPARGTYALRAPAPAGGVSNLKQRFMNIVLVTDIFGRTPALVKLSEELNAKVIVDPYGGVDMAFKNEAEAYSYFMENIGIEDYLSILLKATESISSVCTLVGFSIGASIIWKLSEKLSVKNVNRAICYYGSQIRNFKEVSPLFEIELIFPKKELHFDVLELQNELSKKKNVNTTKVDYLHGFMNLYSTNYNQFAYNEQLNWLRINAC
uniref:hypothetical protein n=1 Tax=uncultured Paraglaciecola sp. TaxID=1765024 RepID=UPI00259501BC